MRLSKTSGRIRIEIVSAPVVVTEKTSASGTSINEFTPSKRIALFGSFTGHEPPADDGLADALGDAEADGDALAEGDCERDADAEGEAEAEGDADAEGDKDGEPGRS